MISRELAMRNEVPEGAYVESVVPDSSADKAGVEPGDIITEFDVKKVLGKNIEVSQFIAQKKVGDSVKIRVYRDNKYVDLTATLETAPDQ
jgi:serine protease Do